MQSSHLMKKGENEKSEGNDSVEDKFAAKSILVDDYADYLHFD